MLSVGFQSKYHADGSYNSVGLHCRCTKEEEQLRKTGKYYDVTCREKHTLVTVHVCKTWNIRSPSRLRRDDIQGSHIELPSRDHLVLIDWATT